MNATAPISLAERVKQEMQHRIAQELTRAREAGQRFTTLQHRMQDGCPHEFVQAVVEVANAMEIPPHAVAPYGDMREAKTPRSVICTVIVSF